ncbi:MAG: DUF115 domain-containing protein [Spirochaetales bacterium]|nr:DUF115 domain-containing protein [Spirochaetales bacterium]
MSDLPVSIVEHQGRRRVLVCEKNIQSLRSPQEEARQWVREQQQAETLFLIGDVTGDLTRAWKELYPQTSVVVLTASRTCFVELEKAGASQLWSPSCGPLENVIEDTLYEKGPQGVRLLCWPHFERAVPNETREWAETFRKTYRIVQGSWLTKAAFGRRFGRNAVRNLLRWQTPFRLVPGSAPIVVAASGPSLTALLPWLKRYRERYELWALPSSLRFLVAHGFTPDLGVATDGGWYARELLWPLHQTTIPLLCALTSAADRIHENHPVAYFSQGEAWELELASGFSGLLPPVPSQGTVAVSAVQLACAATTGPVLVAGMDLAYAGGHSHPSPHPADERLSALSQRLSTDETRHWQTLQAQSLALPGGRTSPAMKTYAEWLDAPQRFSRPVFRLLGEPPLLHWQSMVELQLSQAESLLLAVKGTPSLKQPYSSLRSEPFRWPDREERRRLLYDNLARLRSLRTTDTQLAQALSFSGRQPLFEEDELDHWERLLC